MGAKLILDQDAINESDFEGSRILGITAPIKNYQFCILLNQIMGFEFRFNPNHEIALKRKNRTYYFSMYEATEPSTSIQHFVCLLYTSPSPRDGLLSRMPSSA